MLINLLSLLALPQRVKHLKEYMPYVLSKTYLLNILL